MTAPSSGPLTLIIPPRGRAVLCVWTAVPGAAAAPFLFWQNLWAGLAFCAAWAGLVWAVQARACSFVAALGSRTLRVYAGVVFPVEQMLPRGSVTSALQLRTPLLRLAGASLLVLSAPGVRVFLPAVDAAQADALVRALRGEAAP